MRLIKVIPLIIGLSLLLYAQEPTFNMTGFVQSQPTVVGSPWEQDHTGGSRGILSKIDLDKDGNQEVWVTDYSYGGRVHAFEASGTDTLALVWSSSQLDTVVSEASAPRWIQTGDVDGDGRGEVIFPARNRYYDPDGETIAGIYFFEWDGTDNGFGTEPTFFFDLFTGLNDTLEDVRVEHFSVGDLDGDNQDELVLAVNGATNSTYGSKTGTNYSGDRLVILSIDGQLGSGFETVVEEFSVSPRDVDKDGVIEAGLGSGSPLGALIVDTDGDGLKEVACFSWNALDLFFVEAIAANTYSLGDTTYVLLNSGHGDDWTLAPTAGDIDQDGDDEVFVAGYNAGRVYAIDDRDGDATNFDGATETGCIAEGPNMGASFTPLSYFNDGPTLFFGGTTAGDGDIIMLNYTGTELLDSLSWTVEYFATDTTPPVAGGSAHKIFAGADLDGDNYGEIVLGFQGIPDTDDKRWIVRVAEYSEEGLSVRPITVITPADYSLDAAYPNPFNSTTTINYSLPMSGRISLTLYNLLGEEVIRLVDNEVVRAGDHQVQWHGRDAKGIEVATGTYIYVLQFGNFQKVRRVTFLK